MAIRRLRRHWSRRWRPVWQQIVAGDRRRVRLKRRNGGFRAVSVGAWYTYWRDPYHLLLTIPWLGFFGAIALAYIAINALFAIAYLAGNDPIANARPGSFFDAFTFSVQTLASIGYGAMYPQTVYANLLVVVEALVGLLSVAIVTGLAFARFAQPTARVVFSDAITVAEYNGTPTLMLRVANRRGNQILEAEMRLYLLRDEISREGEFMRRIYELALQRDRTPNFTLTWTAMHPIDANSPLWGATAESLAKVKAQIEVSLTGLDETVSQAIHARRAYSSDDMLWNHRFVDIIYEADNGDRYLDFSHFHAAVPSARLTSEESRHARTAAAATRPPSARPFHEGKLPPTQG